MGDLFSELKSFLALKAFNQCSLVLSTQRANPALSFWIEIKFSRL